MAIKIVAIALALILASVPVLSETTQIAYWSFDGSDAGANAVEDAPSGRLEGATPVEGHKGKALAFEDWSVKDYLKPDPRKATRVIVPHDDVLNPAPPFRVGAWIYPTAKPIYYGGIVEKGQGFGSSYRLLLLRDMRVEGSLGAKHHSVLSAEPLKLNAWTEVSLVVDATSLVLLLNGKEAGRTEFASGTLPTSTSPVVIGERFSGRIDEVSIERP